MAKLTRNSGSSLTQPRTLGPLVAKIESSSCEGKIYEIREASDGTHLYCNCPAWRFQKGKSPSQRSCKHLRSFQEGRTFQAPKAVKALRG